MKAILKAFAFLCILQTVNHAMEEAPRHEAFFSQKVRSLFGEATRSFASVSKALTSDVNTSHFRHGSSCVAHVMRFLSMGDLIESHSEENPRVTRYSISHKQKIAETDIAAIANVFRIVASMMTIISQSPQVQEMMGEVWMGTQHDHDGSPHDNCFNFYKALTRVISPSEETESSSFFDLRVFSGRVEDCLIQARQASYLLRLAIVQSDDHGLDQAGVSIAKRLLLEKRSANLQQETQLVQLSFQKNAPHLLAKAEQEYCDGILGVFDTALGVMV